MNRDSVIDELRGIAILLVITIHTGQVLKIFWDQSNRPLHPLIQYIFELGNYGVPLFFMISGYLMSNLYESSLIVRSHQKFSFVKFYKRRFVRIFPLWIMFALIAVLEYKLLKIGPINFYQESQNFSWKTVFDKGVIEINLATTLKVLLLASAFLLWTNKKMDDTVVPGGWSIQTEVLFYCIFPFIRKLTFKFIAISLFVLQVGYLIIKPTFSSNSSNLYNPVATFFEFGFLNSITFFVLGLLICELKNGKIALKQSDILWFFLLYTTGAFFPMTRGSYSEALLLVFGFIFVYFFNHNTKPYTQIFGRFGKYTYFMYFIHFQILFLLVHLFNALAFVNVQFSNATNLVFLIMISLCIPIVTFISYVLAKLSWRFFEEPLIKRFSD